ncbi:SH3 domain-containing protein [Roseococcus sp.]|uniref:SH3 domain-containing protein n=1 Tax=Roseococcus sp. TaxID=2109646 RepID=UPI003BA8E772
MRAAVALAALIALAACKEHRATSLVPVPEERQLAARTAVEASLQSRLRGQGTRPRGVQVFSQALRDTVAVCGRSAMTGVADSRLIPYVAVVSFEGEAARVANLVFGATGPEASRVFVEMVDRCFDGGGPATTRVTARIYPPLPVPAAAEPEILAEARPEPARPLGTVTVSARSPANLRSASHGGEVIRSLPASSTLEVIGEAPGGWYQVGQSGRPMGWVHGSVLEPRGR